MASPIHVIEHLGGMTVEGGVVYTGASILTSFPTADVMIMKTRTDVHVGIDGTDAFVISFNESGYLATGKTYIFSADCIIAIGKYVVIN